MDKEEIEKVLEELNQAEPSHLNEKALRLFNAIMSIADERDLLQFRINEAIKYITKIQEKEIENNYVIDGDDLEYVKEVLKGEE